MSGNQVELKCIFQLFDSNNTGEVDIRVINQLINSLDGLSKKRLTIPPKQPGEVDKTSMGTTITTKPGLKEPKSAITKRVASDNSLQDLEKNDREKLEKELKFFPNKKTTINFNDFCQLFNEALSQKDIQEEMLLNCFYAFDYNQEGYITSKKIKEVFDIFKEKATQEDIENVLKFVGCTQDTMTYNEFKDFFKKNL